MSRRTLISAAILPAVLIMFVSTGLAKQQVAYLKDGRKLTGEITKTKAGYEIRIEQGASAMVVVIPEADVLRVEDAVTPETELQQRLKRVKPDDPEGLYGVAVWARENRLLEDARDLLQKVLKLRPEHENAKLILRLVEISLTEKAPTTAKVDPPVGPDVRGGDGAALKPEDLLTQEDIYRIRLLELRKDDRVPVEFRNKVLERFIERMRGEGPFADPAGERKFRGLRSIAQTLFILDNTDRADAAIRDDILVKGDPKVMREFRTVIWPIIVQGCARTTCHGGTQGKGELKLFNAPLSDDRVAYTNFYILHAWEKDGRKMINRASPEDSLLLQCGLPRDIATPALAHPEKVDPPVFASREERNYRLVDAWARSLRTPLLPPGYRVAYKLPALKAQASPTPAKAPEKAPTPVE